MNGYLIQSINRLYNILGNITILFFHNTITIKADDSIIIIRKLFIGKIIKEIMIFSNT